MQTCQQLVYVIGVSLSRQFVQFHAACCIPFMNEYCDGAHCTLQCYSLFVVDDTRLYLHHQCNHGCIGRAEAQTHMFPACAAALAFLCDLLCSLALA